MLLGCVDVASWLPLAAGRGGVHATWVLPFFPYLYNLSVRTEEGPEQSTKQSVLYLVTGGKMAKGEKNGLTKPPPPPPPQEFVNVAPSFLCRSVTTHL